MEKLFNDNWEFCEIPLNNDDMYKDGNPVLFNPEDFFETSKKGEYKK